MPLYLLQAAYTSEAWANQVKNPRNRIDDLRGMLENTEITIRDAWYAFGEYDLVLLIDAPGEVDAASVAITAAAGGATKALKTTPLLTVDDGIEAIRRAGEIGYRPPAGG